MPSLTLLSGVLVAVVVIFASYVYLFGIPPEMKRKMEEKALETMGENKASYMTKDMLGKIPDSDQKDIKDLKGSLSNAAGGALRNPLGKEAGNTGDELTSPLTGR